MNIHFSDTIFKEGFAAMQATWEAVNKHKALIDLDALERILLRKSLMIPY